MKIAFLMRTKYGDRTQFGVPSSTCAKMFFWNPHSAIREVQAFDPDVLFVNKQYHMPVIKELVKKYPLIYFYGDYRNPLPEMVKAFMKMAKLNFFTWRNEALYKNYGNIVHVTQGVNPDIWKTHKGQEVKYDVAFSGSYYGTTLRINTLRLLDTHYNLLIVGDGWPKDLKSISKKRGRSTPKYMSQAKVTVGIYNRTNFGDYGKHYVSGYTSNRLYQGFALDSPHINPYCMGLSNVIPQGLLQWTGESELIDLVHTFINNDKFAKMMGAKQRSGLLMYHTVLHAWKRMERDIKNAINF